jgi:hypothetical protein
VLQALQVWTDNKGASPSWHLDMVVVTLTTGTPDPPPAWYTCMLDRRLSHPTV